MHDQTGRPLTHHKAAFMNDFSLIVLDFLEDSFVIDLRLSLSVPVLVNKNWL